MINLRLLQMSDSALPVGGYTHSWGLEAAIARRTVHDAASLETWARAWLRHSLGPLEGVVVASACRAAIVQDWPEVVRANHLLTASLSAPSVRAASHEMGEQLLSLGSTWLWCGAAVERFQKAVSDRTERDRWNHAVIFGVLGSLAEASSLETVVAFLHQSIMGIIGAGVRAVPVGHTNGQQILAYLHSDIEQCAVEIDQRTLDRAAGGCPFYEVLCHEQTTLYARVFRS